MGDSGHQTFVMEFQSFQEYFPLQTIVEGFLCFSSAIKLQWLFDL